MGKSNIYNITEKVDTQNINGNNCVITSANVKTQIIKIIYSGSTDELASKIAEYTFDTIGTLEQAFRIITQELGKDMKQYVRTTVVLQDKVRELGKENLAQKNKSEELERKLNQIIQNPRKILESVIIDFVSGEAFKGLLPAVGRKLGQYSSLYEAIAALGTDEYNLIRVKGSVSDILDLDGRLIIYEGQPYAAVCAIPPFGMSVGNNVIKPICRASYKSDAIITSHYLPDKFGFIAKAREKPKYKITPELLFDELDTLEQERIHSVVIKDSKPSFFDNSDAWFQQQIENAPTQRHKAAHRSAYNLHKRAKQWEKKHGRSVFDE